MYKLKNGILVCPFCGGFVRVEVCDDEGNLHPEEGYESNPWSGLGYKLMHEEKDVPKGRRCPIATYDIDERCQGTYIYDSRDEAYAAWTQ